MVVWVVVVVFFVGVAVVVSVVMMVVMVAALAMAMLMAVLVIVIMFVMIVAMAVVVIVVMAVGVHMRVSMRVPVSMVMMRAAMPSVWLVDTRNRVHKIMLVAILIFQAWQRKVPKCNQVENVACQTYESSNQHKFGINLEVLVGKDPVSRLDRQPNDHRPDNQYAS